MRVLSFLSFIAVVAAISRHENLRHPRNLQRKTRNPQHKKITKHLVFPETAGGNLTKYVPSKAELNALRKKVADSVKSKATKPTPNVSNPLQGVIAAYVQPHKFAGYVALQLTSYFHTSPLTTDLSQAAVVTLPSAAPAPNFELSIANASAPFLGTIEGYSGSHWGPGLPGYGSMTVVHHSKYPASNRNNPTGLPSESNIWSYNPSTGQLTAVWFNDDGKKIPCTIFYDATYGDMNFGGDLPAFVNTYHDTDYATTLYFVPHSYHGL